MIEDLNVEYTLCQSFLKDLLDLMHRRLLPNKGPRLQAYFKTEQQEAVYTAISSVHCVLEACAIVRALN